MQVMPDTVVKYLQLKPQMMGIQPQSWWFHQWGQCTKGIQSQHCPRRHPPLQESRDLAPPFSESEMAEMDIKVAVKLCQALMQYAKQYHVTVCAGRETYCCNTPATPSGADLDIIPAVLPPRSPYLYL